MSSFSRAQLQRFAAQGAAQKVDLFEATISVTASDVTTRYRVALEGFHDRRELGDSGGFITLHVATLLVPIGSAYTPAGGDEFTHVETSEVYRIRRVSSEIQGYRCECIRL